MKELINLVEEWADERCLIKRENAPMQYLKFLEEVGETARAILKKDEAEIIDGFGDIAITIIILSKQLGVNISLTSIGILGSYSFFSTVSSVSEENIYTKTLGELAFYADHLGYDLEKCLLSAYNTIKNRKGKTIDGTFVKD